jgi:hypothetical protein
MASLSLLIPLFAKNSRLGYFFNAKNLHGELIAVFAMRFLVFEFLFGLALRRFSKSKFHFDFRRRLATGTASLSLLVPFLAKNSRLGYFFYAKNPQGGS